MERVKIRGNGDPGRPLRPSGLMSVTLIALSKEEAASCRFTNVQFLGDNAKGALPLATFHEMLGIVQERMKLFTRLCVEGEKQ